MIFGLIGSLVTAVLYPIIFLLYGETAQIFVDYEISKQDRNYTSGNFSKLI